MSTVEPFHELVSHTAEVGVRMGAPTFGELLAEAGRAFADVEGRGAEGVPDREWTRLVVRARDRTSLLVEWLNELVYRAETAKWIPVEFRVDEVGQDYVALYALGMHLERAPGLVKAATYHGAAVREVPGGFEGEVVLDV